MHTMLRTTLAVCALTLVGIASTGCATFLSTRDDRVDHCIQKQKVAVPGHTQAEYYNACRKWEIGGELDDDGNHEVPK